MIISSIKIKNIEITTDVLAALPTPCVPLDALYPWKQPVMPIVNPNTIALSKEEKMSRNEMLSNASSKKVVKLVCSFA
jgi:hypothetical protein